MSQKTKRKLRVLCAFFVLFVVKKKDLKMKHSGILLLIALASCSQPAKKEKQPADYVNPFIGTGG